MNWKYVLKTTKGVFVKSTGWTSMPPVSLLERIGHVTWAMMKKLGFWVSGWTLMSNSKRSKVFKARAEPYKTFRTQTSIGLNAVRWFQSRIRADVVHAGPSLQLVCRRPCRLLRMTPPQSDFLSKRVSTVSRIPMAAVVAGWATIGATPHKTEAELILTIPNTLQMIMLAEHSLMTRLHRDLQARDMLMFLKWLRNFKKDLWVSPSKLAALAGWITSQVFWPKRLPMLSAAVRVSTTVSCLSVSISPMATMATMATLPLLPPPTLARVRTGTNAKESAEGLRERRREARIARVRNGSSRSGSTKRASADESAASTSHPSHNQFKLWTPPALLVLMEFALMEAIKTTGSSLTPGALAGVRMATFASRKLMTLLVSSAWTNMSTTCLSSDQKYLTWGQLIFIYAFICWSVSLKYR